ncbi:MULTISPECIES: hypothetical protein [unclassified Microcoleus]|uniref:hypothetical protein n=1 Tax=unclassified Microcoleus TaxID=2642155 RepID=UPI002FCF6901
MALYVVVFAGIIPLLTLPVLAGELIKPSTLLMVARVDFPVKYFVEVFIKTG